MAIPDAGPARPLRPSRRAHEGAFPQFAERVLAYWTQLCHGADRGFGRWSGQRRSTRRPPRTVQQSNPTAPTAPGSDALDPHAATRSIWVARPKPAPAWAPRSVTAQSRTGPRWHSPGTGDRCRSSAGVAARSRVVPGLAPHAAAGARPAVRPA